MARRGPTFKLADLTRLLKGAKAAGLDVARVRIGKDGSIEIEAGSPSIVPEPASENDDAENPWDTL